MTMPAHPIRNIGDPIPRSEWAKDAKNAAEGSHALKWRTAVAICGYAQHNRLTVANAINELLYAGELR